MNISKYQSLFAYLIISLEYIFMEFYRPKDINVKVLDKTLQKGYFIPPIFSTSHSTQKHGEMQKFK